ncbi:phage major capsid protein, HK97 family [Chitinophaga eiseniae]|uniref:Phage major capsid protein, HK97 family n=1 Tax=Chitinophaga eiseniae TaxID=634771 RepID=A0A1T4SNT9_9BACT|nr:phage major capsid protein [Chitinophaga eiseniae]SKA29806.1 phage major capsid protein, HK97 family [Chitinophaga eiseniae]
MEVKDIKKAFQEELEPVVIEVKGAKSAAEEAKKASDAATEEAKKAAGKVDSIEGEVKNFSIWQKSKDEADQKNQEALDKLIEDSQKKNVAVGTERKHFRDLLAESIQENAGAIEQFASKKSKDVAFQMKAVGDMTLISPTTFPTANVSVTDLRPGIIEQPRRRLHIRQLLSGGSMSGSHYAYVKEIAGEGAPAPTADGAAKPRLDLRLQEVSVPAETIAGIVKVSRKMLRDVQGLTTFLQSRLPEKLLRAEDEQLLNGDGTSPNISGITDAGNFTPFSGASQIWVEQLVEAITQLEEADRDVNGILVRPADYATILLNRASGSGEYDLPRELVTYVNGQLYVSGVPVFKSTAANPGQFIVGDWVMGANLIIQEPPILQFFEQDEDNVQKNMVTVRIEETICFPIYGNDYFIVGDFYGATT